MNIFVKKFRKVFKFKKLEKSEWNFETFSIDQTGRVMKRRTTVNKWISRKNWIKEFDVTNVRVLVTSECPTFLKTKIKSENSYDVLVAFVTKQVWMDFPFASPQIFGFLQCHNTPLI